MMGYAWLHAMSLRCIRYSGRLTRKNRQPVARQASYEARALPDFNPSMVGRLELRLCGRGSQIFVGENALRRFHDPVHAIDKEEAKIISHPRAPFLEYDAAVTGSPKRSLEWLNT